MNMSIDAGLLAQRVRELPALPKAALDALAALRDDVSSAQQCGELIARDQALVARVLRLANSAFYGVPGRVASVGDAVHLLGRRTLGSLLTVATVSQQFNANACASFSFPGFWRHALATALAARALAGARDADAEQAFTAGLLHDIGRLVLAAHFPAQMDAAVQRAHADDVRLTQIEHEALGTDHLAVGTLVATQWRFPQAVVLAIGSHHLPQADSDGQASLADIVHAADAIAHALDLAGDAHDMVPALDAAAWQRMAMPAAAVLRIFADTETQVVQLCQAMDL